MYKKHNNIFPIHAHKREKLFDASLSVYMRWSDKDMNQTFGSPIGTSPPTLCPKQLATLLFGTENRRKIREK